eukprot:4204615-Amphidinium_carterae.1
MSVVREEEHDIFPSIHGDLFDCSSRDSCGGVGRRVATTICSHLRTSNCNCPKTTRSTKMAAEKPRINVN